MRISDWSSDVCSSDLGEATLTLLGEGAEHDAHHCLEIPAFAIDDIDGTGELAGLPGVQRIAEAGGGRIHEDDVLQARGQPQALDRKSDGSGQSVPVRVDLSGRRIMKKKKIHC